MKIGGVKEVEVTLVQFILCFIAVISFIVFRLYFRSFWFFLICSFRTPPSFFPDYIHAISTHSFSSLNYITV